MGCDIHMVVEVFDWFPTDDGSDEVQRWRMVVDEPATYRTRNYSLFAALAGVRNYWDLTPLASRRGLPNDVTPEAKASSESTSDWHSHSWCTVAEVLAFDWSTIGANGAEFVKWAKWLAEGPTRIARCGPENIRLVFWFDN